MVFVGDEEKDMCCARHAGVYAVLVNRDKAKKDYGQDMEINSLAELIGLLGQWRKEDMEKGKETETKKTDNLPFLDVEAVRTGMVGWKAKEEKREITVYLSRKKGICNTTKNPAIRFVPAQGISCSKSLLLPMEEDTWTDVWFCASPEEKKQKWDVQVVWCANPVLPGQFADPDIALFGDTYYLYATTDGFAGWSGTYFHVFSSKDLVNFVDEGVILDVAGDDVAWAVGSAWAPCIAAKGGKYYFYFCAKDAAGDSHIGVAVADSPTGPFQAMQEPLLTKRMCEEHGILMGQTIDPSVFTDEDGASYLLFGNGHAAVVRLLDDMVSLDLSTLTQYRGADDFREAITVTKRGGVYHFTWSCDDTGSPDYHVNYGTSESIYGPIDCHGTLLSKDAENGILGTGHHCILSVPGDKYYIVYHRFYTPLGLFQEGLGFHREICIDRLYFNEETGRMLPVKPTHKGIKACVPM
ncbi:MAG: family 43 glycosylhydrolase [Lachnospiraceae bacterium]|nr:family 43 glycosylhydrolase [Lachnospiraceae bacterium]